MAPYLLKSQATTGKDNPMNETTKPRCSTHGGKLDDQGLCPTVSVLLEVERERRMQFAKYGTNEDLEDGTGGAWLFPLSPMWSAEIEAELRGSYEEYETVYGRPTWMHLVREEVAEAFAETDPARLREELIQVAALCVSWVEKIDQQEGRKFSTRVQEALEGLPRKVTRAYTDAEWRDALEAPLEAPLEARCVCGHTKAAHYLARPTCTKCGCSGLFVSTVSTL